MRFELPIPTGINALYKQGKHGWYKSKEAQEWLQEALWAMKLQGKGQDKPKGESVYITWVFKDKRRRDIDSGIKLLLDAIVTARIIKDDSQIIFLQVQKTKGYRNTCLVEII